MADPSDPEKSDAALVEAALAGDARSFETLLLRYESRVLRVLRLLGVPDQDRADVAQETFLRVFRHLGGFHPKRPFGAWIYRVTVNSAQDYRQSSNRLRRGETSLTDQASSIADPRDDPETAARREGEARRLEAALGTLSERERTVFVLKELEGLGTRETAQALGVTSITVRRHLGLARKRLRTALGQAPEEKSGKK